MPLSSVRSRAKRTTHQRVQRAARWSVALACLAGWYPLSTPAAAIPNEATALEPAIVAVTVNGAARGDLFIHRAPSGRLLLRRQDLPTIGLALTLPTVAMVDGAAHVVLDETAGLALALDEASLTLAITAEPRLLTRQVIEAAPRSPAVVRLAGEGAFLNWALERSVNNGPSSAPTTLALEAGARLGPTLWLSRGQTVSNPQGGSRFVRLSTSVTRDVPERLVRWTWGDLATASDELGQGVLLGGVSLGTLARLDPYRIRYPLGTVQGQALIASEVDVYVDGQRVRTERVPAGVFEIRDLNTPPGARSVQLVVRDPYGRIQRFDQSVYTSQRLLAPGTHDFHYAVGALRRRLGQDSSDYGSPAFALRHAWGASSGLTLGLRAEGRPGLLTGGPALTWRVATAGLLHASLAASQAGALRGQAGLVRYEYQSPRWGAGVTWRVEGAGYAVLSEPRTLGDPQRELQGYASLSVGEGQSVWASHARLTTAPASRPTVPEGWQLNTLTPRQSTSIGYAAWIRPWGGSLRVTASRISDERGTRHELGASLVFVIAGGGLASTQVQSGRDGSTQSVQWSRPTPADTGWGYDLSATRHAGAPDKTIRWRATTDLASDAIRLRADLSGSDGADQPALRLAAAGSFAFIGGRGYRGRPIEDSFAVVEVGQLAGVPVTVNGRAAGQTGADGRLLVARVGAHHESVFEIDSRTIPIDHAISSVQRRVVLPERSGAVIRFETKRLRALTARLVTRFSTGHEPLERVLVRIGTGPDAVDTTTGLQGEIYLENLAPGEHAGMAHGPGGVCEFRFTVPHADEVLVELGPLACEPSVDAQNRSVGPR